MTRVTTLGDSAPLMREAFAACRRHFTYLMLFSAAINLLYLAPSIFMIQVYDRVLSTGGLLTLAFLCLVLLVAIVVLVLVDAMRMRLLGATSRRIDRILSPAVLSAVLSHRGLPADVRSQLPRDFDAFRSALSGPPAIAIVDMPWALLYIAVCFLIHPAIGGIALLGCVAMAVLAALNNMMTRSHFKRGEEAHQAHLALQAGDAAHASVIRSLGMADNMAAREEAGRMQLRRIGEHMTDVSSTYVSLGKFLRLLLQSGTLALGALLAVDRLISPGAMIAASILVSRAFSPIEQMIATWQPSRYAIDAYRRINRLLTEYRPTPAREDAWPAQARVALDHVVLRAPDSSRPLLHDISLTISPGEIVVIMGPSGAGKSLLLKTSVGQILPDEGTVRVDDRPIVQWSEKVLGRAIGYVPQEIGLFMGSLGDNISRFDTFAAVRPDDLTNQLEAAARACGIHHAIRALPKGYDTRLGPSGQGISMGQAQRVAIARALYGNPAIIIMDEPNAHLDIEGERALLAALADARRRGATTLVAVHRPSLIDIADRIAIMQNGRIVDIGPRDAVLRRLSAANSGPDNKAVGQP